MSLRKDRASAEIRGPGAAAAEIRSQSTGGEAGSRKNWKKSYPSGQKAISAFSKTRNSKHETKTDSKHGMPGAKSEIPDSAFSTSSAVVSSGNEPRRTPRNADVIFELRFLFGTARAFTPRQEGSLPDGNDSSRKM
jgi:hypothetical protein